jgi:hypothetical protein
MTQDTWRDIASAPKDGTMIMLTDGNWVHPGWWKACDKWPWRFVDNTAELLTGCCDHEAGDRIAFNGWGADSPTYWQPLPAPPTE